MLKEDVTYFKNHSGTNNLISHFLSLNSYYRYMTQVGFTGSILCNASLSIYYVCVISFGTTEKSFKKKIEPWLHLISNVASHSSAIILLLQKKYGSISNMCWVPLARYRIFVRVSYPICTAVILFNMVVIVFSYMRQKNKQKRWAKKGFINSRSKLKSEDPRQFDLKIVKEKAAKFVEGASNIEQPGISVPTSDGSSRRMPQKLQGGIDRDPSISSLRRSSILSFTAHHHTPRGSRNVKKRHLRQRQVLCQALLYMGCYIVSFIFPMIYR